MAFCAGHRGVRSGELEFRRRVTEPAGRLPCFCRMAARAFRAELAAMLVLVAANAGPRKPQVRAVQVLDLNPGTCRCWNLVGGVALLAFQCGVLPGERKAGLPMVQGFAVWLPADELKIQSVMFGMTARAIFARCVRGQPGRVHALSLRYASPYLRMTIEALQLDCAAPQVMALGAIEHAGE